MTLKTRPKNGNESIVVENLSKSFGDLKVLRGINFKVKRGAILALLGPNGAGKTTTIRILSTLLRPDGGKASINGYDVVRQSASARQNIGLTGQFAAVDEYLSGAENLQMIGRLYRLSFADTEQRTEELLRQFDLVEASTRPVKTYSGGMKRRLDLAMSIIAKPPVIFLDEPTTGLDPRSRLTMWGMIRTLAGDGTTILLTTQYMEEADQLANGIVVIDNGRVIAEGDSSSLKARVGSEHVDLTLHSANDFAKAQAALIGESLQLTPQDRVISIAIAGGAHKLKSILQQLEDNDVEVENVNLRRPTLDDVFLTLTGHSATDDADDKEDKE